MKVKTHNNKQIDTNDTSLMGEILTSYNELVAAFGKPTVGDSYKTDAEWHIEFADGEVATIYNWKNGRNYLGADGYDVKDISDWHIGGRSKCVVDRIKIYMDLKREQREEQKQQTDAGDESLFEGAVAIMEMLHKVKGADYSRTVRAGVICHKLHDLFGVLCIGLNKDGALDEKKVEMMHAAVSDLLANVLSIAAENADLDTDNDEVVKELMNWVTRVCEQEQSGVKRFIKTMRSK